jgi:hypothetical protein
VLFNRVAAEGALGMHSSRSPSLVEGGRIALCAHLKLDLRYHIVGKDFRIA